MAQTKYQVSLSVDGKHSASVQSDDPAAVTEGLIWAQETYKKLTRLSQARQVSNNGQEAGPLDEGQSSTPIQPDGSAPLCGVHEISMVLMHGRRGDFWSCHEKNPDGSWCSYRPS
jgi:hypothetical protein